MQSGGSVAVIIVNWNSAPAAAECVRSLRAGETRRPQRILLVDNASEPADRRALREVQGAELIFLETNRGFAGACNDGAARSRAPYFLFLNPDVKAQDQAVEEMASWLDAHSDASGAGGHLMDEHGQSQFGFMVRKFPTLL